MRVWESYVKVIRARVLHNFIAIIQTRLGIWGLHNLVILTTGPYVDPISRLPWEASSEQIPLSPDPNLLSWSSPAQQAQHVQTLSSVRSQIPVPVASLSSLAQLSVPWVTQQGFQL